MKKNILLTLFSFLFCALAAANAKPPTIIVGSKLFTESVILGEIISQLGQKNGIHTEHKRALGGTRILWNALLKGDIDAYPEYSGTLENELFQGTPIHAIDIQLKQLGIKRTQHLGFNNTYAIGMKRSLAEKRNIHKISDLRQHKDLKIGFTSEFMDRADGWKGLKATYKLPHNEVNGIDHDLAYRGLQNDDIHVIDCYTTDAEIPYYDLKILEDDLNYFPRYDAMILYRADLEQKSSGFSKKLESLSGTIPENVMIAMNSSVKINRKSEIQTAAEYLEKTRQLAHTQTEESFTGRFWRHSLEHLWLVVISLSAAIIVAIPLGIFASTSPNAASVIMSLVGIIQTIPALALLVFMIPLLGIGAAPAMMALFLYSLLPIVRNTYTGLKNIPDKLKESGMALGLPAKERLRKIELPMATPTILAGIKTSAVINVGTATLGALIGAGGYGQPILTGIRLDNLALILQGAIPAAVLALLVQGCFEILERFLVPRGLKG